MNARARTADFAPGAAVPALAWKPERAARQLDISVTTFTAMVKEGLLPKPIAVPGHPGLVLYDARAVAEAWEALASADDRANDRWDDVR